MKMAKKLAKIYGEDIEEAGFAGLIHDIAKEMSHDEIMKYVKIHKIKMDEIEKRQLGLMHAKLRSIHSKRKI